MKRFKSIVLTAIAVFVAAAYVIVPAMPVTAESSASLSIPPKKNYVINPGKSVSDKLTIRNLDDSVPLNLSLRVIDFTFTDNTGTPKLMLDPNAPQTTWSLRPFMNVPKSVTIGPGDTKTVDMSVAIPAGHGAGSYYSAIIYSAGGGTGNTGGSNVGLSASGVTLVFVTIPGKVHEDLRLQKLGAYNVAGSGKEAGYVFISTDKPQTIGYTLKNNGTVTESPVGSITLQSMFGKKQVINDINPVGSLALIGQARTFTTCIKTKAEDLNFQGARSTSTECTDPDLWPGRYTVTLDAYYGQNGNTTQEIIGHASFWYLPWWFILIATIVILLIVYFVWRAVHNIRRLLGKNRPGRPRRR